MTAVDETVLRRLARERDAEFLSQLVGVFVEHAASGAARALTAAEENSLDEVRLAAHSLVFTAASVGARRLQRSAEEVERLAGEQDWRGIRAGLLELDVAAAEARAAVAAWHAGYVSAPPQNARQRSHSAERAGSVGPGGTGTTLG